MVFLFENRKSNQPFTSHNPKFYISHISIYTMQPKKKNIKSKLPGLDFLVQLFFFKLYFHLNHDIFENVSLINSYSIFLFFFFFFFFYVLGYIDLLPIWMIDSFNFV
jgi:hypothetical protein